MEIKFYNNSSDNQVISKNITLIKSVSAEFFNDSSILNPKIVIKYDSSLFSSNYCFIEYLNSRYYYIDDITILNGSRMLISCSVDVLMTYATQIKGLTVIIDKQSEINTSPYYNDDSYLVDDKQFNTSLAFPNSLLTDGQYVLITAGG